MTNTYDSLQRVKAILSIETLILWIMIGYVIVSYFFFNNFSYISVTIVIILCLLWFFLKSYKGKLERLDEMERKERSDYHRYYVQAHREEQLEEIRNMNDDELVEYLKNQKKSPERRCYKGNIIQIKP